MGLNFVDQPAHGGGGGGRIWIDSLRFVLFFFVLFVQVLSVKKMKKKGARKLAVCWLAGSD